MVLKHKTTKDHYEKYRKMAKQCGVSFNNTEKPMGRTRKRLIELYKEDNIFNNIPLREFDAMFWNYRMYNRGRPAPSSLAESCCMYKHLLIYEVVGCEPEFEERPWKKRS